MAEMISPACKAFGWQVPRPKIAVSRHESGFWIGVAFIGAIDIVWMWHDSIGIEIKPLASVISFVIYYLGIAWLLRLGRPGFVRSTGARVSFALAQTHAILTVTAPLSYLMVSLHVPLIDHPLRVADAVLGFDWQSFAEFTLVKHPLTANVLTWAYISFYLQPFAILTICAANPKLCEKEFLQNYAFTAIICVVIGGILPALGEPSSVWPLQLAEFERVWSGQWHVLDFSTMQGLVVFPSFHAAFAVIAVYAVRHSLPGLLGLAPINLAMLVSTVPVGGHYLTDISGGVMVAGASILCIRRLRKSGQAAVLPSYRSTAAGSPLTSAACGARDQ
jgi:membrane-associated phospholipid phosphatase